MGDTPGIPMGVGDTQNRPETKTTYAKYSADTYPLKLEDE